MKLKGSTTKLKGSKFTLKGLPNKKILRKLAKKLSPPYSSVFSVVCLFG
jgi:hypothetical protein